MLFRSATSSRQSNGKELICIKGSNQKQIDDCLNRLKSEGRKVTATKKRIETNYMPTTYHTFSIGGECFLREVGRIVLNYTALKWPDVARKSELHPIKNSVFGNLKDCYDISYYVSLTADNPFRVDCDHSEFCHYIAIILDHVNSCIYGRVILFGVLDFSVWLGEYDFDISDNVLYIINPLQSKAAPPLCKSLDPSILPSTITRLELFANEVDVPNLMKNQLNEMFKRIDFFHFTKNYASQISGINNSSATNKRSKETRLQRFILQHPELTYILLCQFKKDVIREISQPSSSDNNSDNIVSASILGQLIREDTEKDSGLSDVTEGIICVIAVKLCKAIFLEHSNDIITDRILFEWFRSNKGLEIVSDTFQLLFSRLQIAGDAFVIN